MWVCKNCNADFYIPEKSIKNMGGYWEVVHVCPYCYDENIMEDEEEDDMDG